MQCRPGSLMTTFVGTTEYLAPEVLRQKGYGKVRYKMIYIYIYIYIYNIRTPRPRGPAAEGLRQGAL